MHKVSRMLKDLDALDDAAKEKKVDLKKELEKAEDQLAGSAEAGVHEFDYNGYHVEVSINMEDIDAENGGSVYYTVTNAKGKETSSESFETPDQEGDWKGFWKKVWGSLTKVITKK